jgi:hypothetical protein
VGGRPILELARRPLIDKTRHLVDVEGWTFEIAVADLTRLCRSCGFARKLEAS